MIKFLSILLVFVINRNCFCVAKHPAINIKLNGTNAEDSFTVFAVHFEPYVYVKNGDVYDGIEYHLVKMIGNALNKKISFKIGDVNSLQNAIDNTK